MAGWVLTAGDTVQTCIWSGAPALATASARIGTCVGLADFLPGVNEYLEDTAGAHGVDCDHIAVLRAGRTLAAHSVVCACASTCGERCTRRLVEVGPVSIWYLCQLGMRSCTLLCIFASV